MVRCPCFFARRYCHKLLNISDLPRRKPPFPASLSARSSPLTTVFPGQHSFRSFRRWMSTIDTCQSGLQFRFLLLSQALELLRMMACGRTVTSGGIPADSMCDCFQVYCQAGFWDRIGCIAFVDGGRTLLDSEAPH